MLFRRFVALCFFLLLTLPTEAQAQVTFTSVDVPGAAGTEVNGIDKAGEMVGAYYLTPYNWHGFLFSGGKFTTLDYPGAQFTIATAINDNGQIVGYYTTGQGLEEYGFLYDGHTFTSIQDGSHIITRATGINNAGQMVGATGNSQKQVGFELSSGTFEGIAPPDKSSYYYAFANAINNLGEIVGYVNLFSLHDNSASFIYKGGSFKNMAFPGANSTQSNGVNDSGIIVGTYRLASLTYFGFADNAGRFVSLVYPNATNTICIGINNSGVIVGTYTDPSGVNHGFVTSPITIAHFSGQ